MCKKLLSLIAIVFSVAIVFTACSSTSWNVKKVNYSGDVSSNGGFAVAKGDYVYFINGISSYTADNTFGKVVKGALARVNKAELDKAEKNVDILVPSLLSSGDKDAGVYIFGDYVYYATPTSAKDKSGSVKNESLDFNKTKLDGTSTSTIARTDGNSTVYRFAEVNGNVYLAYVSANSDNSSNFDITVYNQNGKKVTTCENATSYSFGDANSSYVYFVKTAHNDELDQDESFNDLFRLKFGEAQAEQILQGAGSYREGTQGTGSLGVTYSILKYTEGTLYYSYSFVDTSTGTTTIYKAVQENELAKDSFESNLSKGVTLSNGTNADKIFSANSLYLAMDDILFIDSEKGLTRYNYTKIDDTKTYFGLETLEASADINDKIIVYYLDGYLYLRDSDFYYYRVNLTKLLAGESQDLEQLTYYKSATWYQPEVINGCFLTSYDWAKHNGYVFSTPLSYGTLGEDGAKELKELLEGNSSETLEKFIALHLGIFSSEDQKSFDKELEELKTSENK